MTKKDKMIAAFLVSVGIFSAAQAMQYVSNLSADEKTRIGMTVKSSADRIVICSGSDSLGSAGNGNNKTIG